MITLTEQDAQWLQTVLRGDYVTPEVYDKAHQLLIEGSEAPTVQDDITTPCRCNQSNRVRDRAHLRGDERFCRDAIAARRAAAR